MINSKKLFDTRDTISELIGESINGGINYHLEIIKDYLTKKIEQQYEMEKIPN